MAAANAAENSAVTASAAASNAASTTSGWEYSQDKDEMRGTTTYYANVDSSNELQFGFPYEGGHATLHLRQRPQDGLNVIVTIAGQFTCASYMDGHVSVKFDDGPIQRFGCAEPSDGGTGTLFILGAKRFVDDLKKSRRVVIEADFYQNGGQQMDFDTQGLQWPRPQS